MSERCRFSPVMGLLLTAGILSGCATKAGPAPNAGFTDQTVMVKSEKYPFHKIWFKEDLDWNRYTEIQIVPVNITHLPQMDWWKKLERGSHFQEDAKKLALYTENALKEAFRNDPSHHFQVVEQPGSNTLVAEMALVEIVPSKIILNTFGYAPFVGSAAKLLRNTTSKSSVAFEARVRDGATGEIVALFADREFEKMSPVNIKDITWYGHAESIIQEWAHQFVRVANRKKGEIIKDSKPFHLKPW